MGLDEQGLDNRAFLELQREVLRHEARSDDGSRQGADDAAGKDRLANIFLHRERECQERSRRQQHSTTVARGAGTSVRYWRSQRPHHTRISNKREQLRPCQRH